MKNTIYDQITKLYASLSNHAINRHLSIELVNLNEIGKSSIIITNVEIDKNGLNYLLDKYHTIMQLEAIDTKHTEYTPMYKIYYKA